MQINPEEMDRDALLQFYATYTIEKMLASGIAEYIPVSSLKSTEARARALSQPRLQKLLSNQERRLVEEALSKGLLSYPDNEFQAAILYVAAGLFIQINVPRFMEKLGVGGHS